MGFSLGSLGAIAGGAVGFLAGGGPAGAAIGAQIGGSLGGGMDAKKAAGKSAAALEAQGKAEKEAAYFEAEQMRDAANQAAGMAQRQAEQERHNAMLMASRAIAVAAASGAGVTNPTVNRILQDIDKQGMLQSEYRLYEGSEQERKLRLSAGVREWEGDQAEKGAFVKSDMARAQGKAAFTQSILGAVSKGVTWGEKRGWFDDTRSG